MAEADLEDRSLVPTGQAQRAGRFRSTISLTTRILAVNLIPLVMKAVLLGEPVRVFGTDYPTPDGTAIRDYIHVVDPAGPRGGVHLPFTRRTASAQPPGVALRP